MKKADVIRSVTAKGIYSTIFKTFLVKPHVAVREHHTIACLNA